jgi:hypothetical protein
MTKKNYPYQAAGRTWAVRELHLAMMPDKTVVILEEEIDRIHRAIANEICGSPETLSIDELGFLCDVTDTSFAEVADHLGIHRSTVTRWRKAGEVPKNVMSVILKKWFWSKLFGQDVGDRSVPLGHMIDEGAFLSFARQAAIDKYLAEQIEQMRAARVDALRLSTHLFLLNPKQCINRDRKVRRCLRVAYAKTFLPACQIFRH